MASDGLLDLGLACKRLYWPQEGPTDGGEHPVLLILMAMARSFTWVLEQPTSSLMPLHPAL
eukprot:4104945-Pyramimonas_sp.AAC.1